MFRKQKGQQKKCSEGRKSVDLKEHGYEGIAMACY